MEAKAKAKAKPSIIHTEEDDDDFLCQVAAVEAEAQSKRRKINDSSSSIVNKNKIEMVEGAYIAALRGSKSHLWQQTTVINNNNSATNHVHNTVTHEYDVRSDTQKNCPCGLGVCLILTANTDKNRGRKFYKCPVRQENGGCGFFEWCDNARGTNSMTGWTQTFASNSMFPDIPCPCGAGSCLVLTAKTGKNIGQQFYRCPANQGNSCGFFKWCNDHTVAANLPVSASKVYSARTGSSCFKCGKEGHWAKDCPIPSFDSPAELGGRSAESGTCHKCGNHGHWARDCTSTQLMNVRLRH